MPASFPLFFKLDELSLGINQINTWLVADLVVVGDCVNMLGILIALWFETSSLALSKGNFEPIQYGCKVLNFCVCIESAMDHFLLRIVSIFG